MVASSISETKRVRYLLDLCSQEEREHIELDYFEDVAAFQEMLGTEDDLIDAYARGELIGEERRRFEKSFVNSLSGRNRVQFARAFADVVSTTRSVETKPPGRLLNVFKSLQSPDLLPTATIAAMIVFVAVTAWLIIDRRRMANELRELRVEFTELSKRSESLQRNSDNERIRNAETAAIVEDSQTQTERVMHRSRRTTGTRAQHLPRVKDDREKITSSKPGASEYPLNDASLGNTFPERKITELPLEASNVVNLLSLQPGKTRDGYMPGDRADQTKVTLDGVDIEPRVISSSGKNIFFLPNSQSWIRFRILLKPAATLEDYRITIKTADGRSITSVDWSEPLTPNQIIIDTPVISMSDLSSGDYVLLLMGKERDGSFVKVGEYSFRVNKY